MSILDSTVGISYSTDYLMQYGIISKIQTRSKLTRNSTTLALIQEKKNGSKAVEIECLELP